MTIIALLPVTLHRYQVEVHNHAVPVITASQFTETTMFELGRWLPGLFVLSELWVMYIIISAGAPEFHSARLCRNGDPGDQVKRRVSTTEHGSLSIL